MFDNKAPKKMKKKKLVQFTRTMSSMLRASISTGDALKFYAMGHGLEKDIHDRIMRIRMLLENGESPGYAFQKSDLFDDTFCSLVDAGAKAGSMPAALSSISKRLKTEIRFSGKIKKAIAIPIAAGSIITVVFFASQIKLVPMIEKMILDVGQEPDVFSAFVFKLSHVVQAVWIYSIAAIVAFVSSLIGSHKFRSKIIMLIASKWRLLRNMILGFRQLMMLSTLEMLYSNHISMEESLRITAKVMEKTNLGPELLKVAEHYSRGISLHEALTQFAQVDQQIPHLLFIGEKSSSITEQLRNLCELYEEETEAVIDVFTQIISTLSIFLVMLMIGFVFCSAYLPIVLMGPRMMNAATM
jgi:type II secretory pathway component PulF